MPTEEGPTSDREKDKDKDKDKDAFGDDPPIIVGGGGSTWVWIPKSDGLRIFDPATTINIQLPDSDTMPPPGQLGGYLAVYLPNFTVKNINPHDGQVDHGDKPVKD